jgi:hypothetical protein
MSRNPFESFSEAFQVKDCGDYIHIIIRKADGLLTVDLEEKFPLLEVFKAFKVSSKRVLLWSAERDSLASDRLDNFWEHLRKVHPIPLKTLPTGMFSGTRKSPSTQAELELARAEIGNQQLITSVQDTPKPVVAALSGEIDLWYSSYLLASDYRFISDDTVFVNRFIELPIEAGGAAPYFLARILGPAKTTELLLEGNDISADHAYRLGLVSRVVAPDDLENEAQDFASDLAQKSPSALNSIKQAVAISDLNTYFERIGTGFQTFPSEP